MIATAGLARAPRDGRDLADRLLSLGSPSLLRTAVWWLAEHTPPGLAFEEMDGPTAARCWAAVVEQHPKLARLVAEDQRDEWPF